MTSDDEWVKRAMADDSLVSELLCHLRRSDRPQPTPATALRLGWSVRQRRSRAPTRHHHPDEDVKITTKRTKKEKAEPRRASPTTPLSWSGATSFSGGGGVSEDSSKPTSLSGCAVARSKMCVRRSETTISKRPRRKKTLAELREEENLLLKERKKMRREIETMRLNIQKQRATNESYRRLKLDLESQQKQATVTEHSSVLPKTENVDALHRSCSLSVSCRVMEISGFPLPDLNLPADGDLESPAPLCGIAS